jgi:hypothetical protein
MPVLEVEVAVVVVVDVDVADCVAEVSPAETELPDDAFVPPVPAETLEMTPGV